MNVPDLQALQRGDAAAWDEAFRWLWPAAFGAAQAKLQPFLPGDVEDVAIEALEELVEVVTRVKTVEELKPLVACGAAPGGCAAERGATARAERRAPPLPPRATAAFSPTF